MATVLYHLRPTLHRNLEPLGAAWCSVSLECELSNMFRRVSKSKNIRGHANTYMQWLRWTWWLSWSSAWDALTPLVAPQHPNWSQRQSCYACKALKNNDHAKEIMIGTSVRAYPVPYYHQMSSALASCACWQASARHCRLLLRPSCDSGPIYVVRDQQTVRPS